MTHLARSRADAALEHLFTHPNPDTGAPPPPAVAWVLFEHDTVFFTFPREGLGLEAEPGALVAAAMRALDTLGGVVVGTEGADFAPGRLGSWFPDECVYLVTYAHPNVASLFFADKADDLSAGLMARECRQLDYETRRVKVIRDFYGRRIG
ncbi:MAG: hypothetical protein JNK72_21695 [Myxococcales bacterium]|nr:hypothetical protein [Myxococcales bacterium]